MNLPNPNHLMVEREKIVDYLLNPAHRYGAAKARFFARFGFVGLQWEVLAGALREHGQKHEVSTVVDTGFGPRYVVDGELTTPSGRRPMVRSVWQHDYGTIAPRLISAYPLEVKL